MLSLKLTQNTQANAEVIKPLEEKMENIFTTLAQANISSTESKTHKL